MTVIIDYGAGNIKSVEKALLSLGQEVVITDDADTILNAERIILPGVGAFGNAMAQLEKTGLDEVIREAVRRKIPFLGICLGLQLLFEKSDEALGVKGLGVLKGEVKKIPAKKGLKIPHMGWNQLHITNHQPIFIWDGILCILRIMESCFRESKRAHMFILCTLITWKQKKSRS